MMMMRGAIQEMGEEPDILWKYVSGSNFPSINLRERYNSEASRLYVTCSLFADDTTEKLKNFSQVY